MAEPNLKKRGRPPADETSGRLHLRLPSSTLNALQQEANEEDLPLATHVARVLRRHVRQRQEVATAMLREQATSLLESWSDDKLVRLAGGHGEEKQAAELVLLAKQVTPGRSFDEDEGRMIEEIAQEKLRVRHEGQAVFFDPDDRA